MSPTFQIDNLGAPIIKAGQAIDVGLYTGSITATNYFTVSVYTPTGPSGLSLNSFGRSINLDGSVIGIANVTNTGATDVPLWFAVLADVSGQKQSATKVASRAVAR